MAKILAFLRGMIEFRRDMTWADPNRPEDGELTELDSCYDAGRDFIHRVTFRWFDS